MKRQVVVFDRSRCNGCGLCVHACHEGAIGLVDGKAALLRDDFCDGMGDCLPACPMDAIHFEERDTLAYDAAAVARAKAAKAEAAKTCAAAAPAVAAKAAAVPAPYATAAPAMVPGAWGCAPSGAAVWGVAPSAPAGAGMAAPPILTEVDTPSQLAQWPCQIKLVPVNAPFFAGARLLVAADCTAFANADFHRLFMAGRVTLVGCPKLDAVDYSEKLSAILASNDIVDVLVTRMDVPCCGGLQRAVATALRASGKDIPAQVVTLGRDGRILSQVSLA